MSSVDEGERGLDCRAIVEHAPDGIMLTAPDGRILAANPAACALLGRTEEEVRAEGRGRVVVMDEAAEAFRVERSREGRARGVLTLRRKDGSTFLAEVASKVFEGSDGGASTCIVFRDVTEAERARRAMAILAEAGGALVRSLDLPTMLRHLTDSIVPELADVCAVDLREADGVVRVAVAHREPDKIPLFESVRRRAIVADAIFGTDYVLRTGRASAVYSLEEDDLRRVTLDPAHFEAARKLGVRSFVSMPLPSDGQTIGALTLMSVGFVPPFSETDLPLVQALADRAAMAIANASQHAAAIEARRLRDEVLSVVAHDLRSPLNTILLAARNLERSHPGPETDAILRGVRRADALIRDLLLAQKAEAGALPLERDEEDVASILDEVRALHAPIAEAKPVELRVRSAGAPPSVRLDRHRTVQMLSNLVANALKFTPPGGRIELGASGDASSVRFTVSDTGIGIAPADLPRVFDRFWQGAHLRDVGAGLGLAISKKIADAHGGDITVESAPGRGTTFTVVLPRAAA